jgi:hypothetical protein
MRRKMDAFVKQEHPTGDFPAFLRNASGYRREKTVVNLPRSILSAVPEVPRDGADVRVDLT